MDEIKIFQIRIFDLFLCDVFPDAVEHLFGVCRNQGSEPNGKAALDVEAAVALGVSRDPVLSGRGTVCVRLLQCNADVYRSRFYHNDIF